MKRCLVTGANGFIGSALCSRLGQMGVEVVPLTRRPGLPNAIVADLGRDPLALKSVAPDVVFHLAARVHQFDAGPDATAEHERVTVAGTDALLNAAIEAQVPTFVFFSSCAVMPVGVDRPLDETAHPEPTSPYGRAKLKAEQLVTSKNGVNGLNTVSLRLPTVYGPGHKGQLSHMLGAIQKGVFPPIPELGGARSFVHVDDVVEAAILAATSPAAAGGIYIVAEERSYTSRQIYEIALQALGRRPPPWHVPRLALKVAARSGDLFEAISRRRAPFDSDMLDKLSTPAVYSAALIQRELGFKSRHSLAATADELVVPATL